MTFENTIKCLVNQRWDTVVRKKEVFLSTHIYDYEDKLKDIAQEELEFIETQLDFIPESYGIPKQHLLIKIFVDVQFVGRDSVTLVSHYNIYFTILFLSPKLTQHLVTDNVVVVSRGNKNIKFPVMNNTFIEESNE